MMYAHHFLTVILESHRGQFLDQFCLAYILMICLQFVQVQMYADDTVVYTYAKKYKQNSDKKNKLLLKLLLH